MKSRQKRENLEKVLKNTDQNSDWTDSYLKMTVDQNNPLGDPLYSVALADIIRDFSLEVLSMPEGERVKVVCRDVNRPGLPLAGFFDHFEAQRIQIIGKVEYLYLKNLDEESRNRQIRDFMAKKPVALIFSTSLEAFDCALQYAKEFCVPVLRTDRPTLIALASNDAMSRNLKNVGDMLGRKSVYFVPMLQDDPIGKPHSLVAEFELIPRAVESLLKGEQLRPIFLTGP